MNLHKKIDGTDFNKLKSHGYTSVVTCSQKGGMGDTYKARNGTTDVILKKSKNKGELRPLNWRGPYNCKTGLFSIAMVNNFFSNSSGV